MDSCHRYEILKVKAKACLHCIEFVALKVSHPLWIDVVTLRPGEYYWLGSFFNKIWKFSNQIMF